MLTVFGVCFIVRTAFISAIVDSAVSPRPLFMTVETVGLVMAVSRASHRFALIGAGLAGFGLSLVYPRGGRAIKRSRVPVAVPGLVPMRVL